MRSRRGVSGFATIGLLPWSLGQFVAALCYLPGMIARILLLFFILPLLWAVVTPLNAAAAFLRPERFHGPGQTRTALAVLIVVSAATLETLARGFDGLGREFGGRRRVW